MICENCNEREAQIHLTQIEDNSVNTVHLCEQCAAEQGVQTGASSKLPLTDFIASVGKTIGGAVPQELDAGSCSSCGATIQDFRKSGHLGCPACYENFGLHLRDLLRKLHGSHQHVGEVYDAPGAEVDGVRKVAELRKRLQRAVDAENFELAAEIRDELQVLEG
ncbi:MAG: UvrB/UvrC motif-containing protein [Gemmatimonadales bacterium]